MNLSKIFTPARVTLAITFFGAVATVALASQKAFPGGAWPNIAVAIAGVAQHAVGVLKFLQGNSNWEVAQLHAASLMPPPPEVTMEDVRREVAAGRTKPAEVRPMVQAELRSALGIENATASRASTSTAPVESKADLKPVP